MQYVKHLIWLSVYCIIADCSYSQNLVPNPSFENYRTCPTGLSSLTPFSDTNFVVYDWIRPDSSSSDYFHECAEYGGEFSGSVSIPINDLGHQYARTGQAYAGLYGRFYIGYLGDYGEYLQAKLLASLVTGHHYFLQYWVSLGEVRNPSIGMNGLGAHFRNTVLDTGYASSFVPLDYLDAQIEILDEHFVDTTNWMDVSGVFTAAGGEEWIILGNFASFDDITWVNPDGSYTDPWFPAYAYYYVDDVCLMDLDQTSNPAHVIDTTVCDGVEISANGREGAERYEWSTGSTEEEIDITSPGTYWVKSIFFDQCALFIDTFKVKTFISPEINLGSDTTICKNDAIFLNAYHEAIIEYKWSTGQATPSIEVNGPGTYFVNGKGYCEEANDTITIKKFQPPKVLLPNDTFLCYGIELRLGVSTGSVDYLWNTGSQECCITVDSSGTYQLTIIDACGISDSGQVTITYTGCDNCILAPNAFSPNADGINDAFAVITNCILPEYQLRIFNRWGQTVFVSFNPSDKWDGTYNGAPADIGTYYYYLEAKKIIGPNQNIKMKGEIMLIR